MKVIIFEGCRSPKVDKGDTEGKVLSQFFAERAVSYELHSNDSIWPSRAALTLKLVRDRLDATAADVVHFAVHGFAEGLALAWSREAETTQRRPTKLLTPQKIEQMRGWDAKLVVSGACDSAGLAPSFLRGGAAAIVAPTGPIPWPTLGAFFRTFYGCLLEDVSPDLAVRETIAGYPEFAPFGCYRS